MLITWETRRAAGTSYFCFATHVAAVAAAAAAAVVAAAACAETAAVAAAERGPSGQQPLLEMLTDLG